MPSNASSIEGINIDVAPSNKRGARLRLVGSGPGNVDLLTIAAYKAIQEAELVVADGLVPQEILSLVKGELKIASSKRAPFKADKSQDELMGYTLEGLQRGLDVIRLKNGDPFVFGRGGEEVLFFRKHGFEAEVIPGISSSLSAPLMAGIPVTHRSVSDQVLITTAQGKNGSIPPVPPYADHRTTIFLMPVGRLADLCKDLISNGYPSNCPVAMIEKATTPEQRVVRGNLETIAAICEKEKVAAPATMVVGNSVNTLSHSNISTVESVQE